MEICNSFGKCKLFRDNFVILYKSDYKLFAYNFCVYVSIWKSIFFDQLLIKDLVFNDIFNIVIKGEYK